MPICMCELDELSCQKGFVWFGNLHGLCLEKEQTFRFNLNRLIRAIHWFNHWFEWLMSSLMGRRFENMNWTRMVVGRWLNWSNSIFKTLIIALKNMTCFFWLSNLHELCLIQRFNRWFERLYLKCQYKCIPKFWSA